MELPLADLSDAQLEEAALFRADLTVANLRGADLSGARLSGAILASADLSGANLSNAHLDEANLSKADLSGAKLTDADLTRAVLVESRLRNDADLTGCWIYGISAWNVDLDASTVQDNLIITPRHDEPVVTTDNLEVAQFVFLLLHNEKIRQVIDTITSKVVLILGRFTEDRKAVLDAIREELRQRNFTPVLFDFDKPAGKDVTGTVETLARMARFIIADLTDPSSIPHELATVVPFLRTTPVLLLRLKGAGGYSMASDFEAYPWVFKPYEYTDGPALIQSLPEVIAPAEQKADELRRSDVG